MAHSLGVVSFSAVLHTPKASTHTHAVLTPSISEIYEEHFDFVWASLFRLGVREADLPDLCQDVFIVVHRKANTWDQKCLTTTWLFGICRKVAASYRRKAWFRRERPLPTTEQQEQSPANSPERRAVLSEAQVRLQAVLTSLSPDRRALFVMFEFEERSCAEIAELFDIPVGTVHSRLHAARKDFRRALTAMKARERRQR